MPTKVKTAQIILQIVGWLKLVGSVIFILFVLLSRVLIGASLEQGAGVAGAILGIWGLVLAVTGVAYGIVVILTASGVAKKKSWAKTVGIILGIIYLISVPIGTIVGIFVLRGLIGKESDSWFKE